ncbi:hypothetical protein [Desulfolithobacter sp.]
MKSTSCHRAGRFSGSFLTGLGSGTCLLFKALPAFALQTHAAPEGLYAHQIGHVLYFLAMAGLVYKIRNSQLWGNAAWRRIALGGFLLGLWNTWAFVGHVVEALLPRNHFIGSVEHGHTAIRMVSSLDYLYWILRMDHLICVPALVCIYLGLRRMRRERTVNLMISGERRS